MATKTFTQLTAVTTLAAGDELVQWNASAAAARKITIANFVANLPTGGMADLGGVQTFSGVKTFSAAPKFVSGTIVRTPGSFTRTTVSGDNATANDLELMGPNTSQVRIKFSDGDAAGSGEVGYNHSTDLMTLIAGGTGRLLISTDVTPGGDNTQDSGSASKRWNDVYATNATIQTSDEREKTDIQDSTLGLDFIRALRPVIFRWRDVPERVEVVIDEETGEDVEIVHPAQTHKRPHFGLIAQHVKAVMDAQGVVDFAGYIYDAKTDRHGLRYGEFLGPLIRAIQDGADIIAALQADVAALQERVAALEM